MKEDYNYSYEFDKYYCYPNTNVLINKLDIHDAEELKKAEREITSIRIANAKINKIPGKFDFNHLKNIHRYIFQDIYIWAGETRKVNIAKGNMFCSYEFIEDNANSIFKKLKREKFINETTEKEVPISLAYYLSEINAVHPFREGNGRTQRLFIEYLAEEIGYTIDFSKVSKEEMIQASAESFICSYDSINKLFERITEPKQENSMEHRMM